MFLTLFTPRRVGALLLVLLATCSVTWVHAFTQANDNTGAAVTTVASSSALLSVGPCTDNCDANKTGIAAVPSGSTQLVLDFTKGASGGTSYGIQAGATYTFKSLVWVTNNAGRTVSVTASATNAGSDLISIKDQNGNTLVGTGAGAVSVPANGQLKLDIQWQGNSTAGTTRAPQVTFSAS
jgi:hypothetical protein